MNLIAEGPPASRFTPGLKPFVEPFGSIIERCHPENVFVTSGRFLYRRQDKDAGASGSRANNCAR